MKLSEMTEQEKEDLGRQMMDFLVKLYSDQMGMEYEYREITQKDITA